jgi:hypothetical protein
MVDRDATLGAATRNPTIAIIPQPFTHGLLVRSL